VFGIIDILVLILVRRHRCVHCDRVFWAPPPHAGNELAIGKECYVCICGYKYETGRREWSHLRTGEKRKYLWSGLLMVPVTTTALGAIGGYFLRWHEPYWFMSVFIGFLGLLSGFICSGVLLSFRCLPVATSLLRTKRRDQSLNNAIS
jgi:hypothetical protein